MEHKLSPWHSSDTKPVHIGIYEVKCTELGQEYSWWGGKYWSPQRALRDNSEYLYMYKAQYQNKQWRGILK